MRDRAVVAIAVAALVAAWLARPVPLVAVVVAIGTACVLRRPVSMIVAVAVVATWLGARSWEGIRSAPTTGRVATGATVVADPQWVLGAVRAEVRLDTDGRRVQVLARGDAASVLSSRLAGERVRVEGALRTVSPGSRAYLARRHIGSRITATAITDASAGGVVSRFTNQLRRTLVDGTNSMSLERRALFTGLVLGDDREQEPEEIDDFRASGLSHLLAVSGQNVAFVLAVAAPLLRRLALRGRFVASVSILLAFGVLTRWEPSVLRAVAMAALALVASTIGRPAASLRILALAITALVLVDPMLSGSIGFLLSVGACTGIALVGPVLERRRVPAALGITLAAQVGVAPVLLPVFGGIPVASLPANLLAGPAAGPVMMWGLIGGLPAGLLGGRAAWLLHLPTRLLLEWIAGVARVTARLGLPELDLRASVVVVVTAGALLADRHRRHRRIEAVDSDNGDGAARGRARTGAGRGARAARVAVTAGVFVLVALTSSVGARPVPVGIEHVALVDGADVWRRDGATVVVLAGNADGGRLLEALRANGIRSIDVLVVRSGGSAAARLAALVRHRSEVRLALAPVGHRVPGAEVLAAGQVVRVGPLEVVAADGRPPLDVRVGSPGHAPRPRAPPVRRVDARPRDGHPQPDDRLVLRQGPVLRTRRHAPLGRAARRRRCRPARRRRCQGRARS